MVHVPPHVAVEPRIGAVKTRLLLGALGAASAAIGVLPRYPLGAAVCRVAGAAWYLSAPATREAVADNLRHILGRQPTRAEVVRVFHNGALNYWDTFAIPHFSHAQVLDLVDPYGIENIDAARAAGHGVICATAHLGSVAFVGQILPALGYPMVGLLEPLEPPELY